MNNKAKNECPTCDGNKRKPREKHCKLGMCVMTHEGITCSPDGVDCIHYIPSEPCPDCQSQEPETDTSEFVEECRFNLSENAGSVTSYKHRNIERLLKEACDRLEAAKTQIRVWQKRAMTEKSNVIYWKAKLKAETRRADEAEKQKEEYRLCHESELGVCFQHCEEVKQLKQQIAEQQ